MDVTQLKLDAVAEIMEERGITAEDICAAIDWGEGEGGKLIDGDRSLAKKRLDKVMIYAEYTVEDGSYVVSDTYSHRVTLGEEA